MIKIGRVFVDADASCELFWTDRKQGGRLYHFIQFGMYEMNHIADRCKCLSITILFFSFKIGVI